MTTPEPYPTHQKEVFQPTHLTQQPHTRNAITDANGEDIIPIVSCPAPYSIDAVSPAPVCFLRRLNLQSNLGLTLARLTLHPSIPRQ